MTTGSERLAVVMGIIAITPHPNADRLDIIHISDFKTPGESEPEVEAFPWGQTYKLVTGKHYRSGDFGVWLKPNAIIPGWLAHDLWLVGKNRATEDFEVREIEMRGFPSPGLWAGQWYRNDNSKESRLRADELRRGGGLVVDGWIKWARWNKNWKPGDDVTEELGIRPHSSVVEQSVSNREVAAEKYGDGSNVVGAEPAVGSNS